jgi:hypothetical protein
MTAPMSGQSGNSGGSGVAGEPECPVTPAAGQWVAISPDPYGFELASDGSHLSGQGCLGGLPSQGLVLLCSPLVVQRDHGRGVDFVWDMRQAKEASGLAYVVKMNLTLSPERTSLAGKVWTSLGSLEGDGQDVVLVRYPVEQVVPPATACSGGEPSGDCFQGPLRSDRIIEPRVVELGGGSFLLQWMNRRAVDERIAVARFDAATSAWQAPEFLDDGSAPVSSAVLAASPHGWAMVAYRQNDGLVTRSYDPKLNAWSKQRIVVGDGALTDPVPDALLVYDGGDATLIVSSQKPGGSALSAIDSVASEGVWQTPHELVVSADVASTEWAAASDAARHALVVWVRGGTIDEPFEVWFSSRSAGGGWTEPAKLYTGDKQILNPAVAVGPNGTAIVTWQEWITRIASSSYSFNTGTWSEPLTVAAEQQADNGAVAFDAAGTPIAFFHRSNASNGDAEQKTQLLSGTWSVPQAIPSAEANGTSYSVEAGTDDLLVRPLHPVAGQPAASELVRRRCEGY